MAQTKKLLDAAVAVGAGSPHTLYPDNFRRGFSVSLVGTGAVSATLSVQVSNDGGLNWADRMAFSVSGTTLANDVDVDPVSPFPLVRVNVLTLTGTNATLSVSVTASGGV